MRTTKTAQFTPGPWYAANMGNDFQGLVVEEQTGKNIAVAYDKRDVHILAAALAMYEALETVPLPKHNEAIGEFYTRFYTWYEGQVKQALAQAEGR